MSRSRRPTWRTGFVQAMILPTNKDLRNFLRLCRAQATKATSPNQNYVMMHPSAPRPAGQLDALPWERTEPQGTAYFWERNEAPLPPSRPRCNFTHPRQLSPFPESLKLPFSSEEILSGFEEIVSSGTDQFTAWVKNRPSRYLGTTHGRCSKSHRRFSRSIRKET